MAPTVPNPNWPTLFAEGNFGDNPFYGTPVTLPVNTDMAPRLWNQWSVRRGKQFELDTVQAAEWSGSLVNTDGFLDPTNTASTYAPGVIPYRGWRVRAQYPSSINLVNGDCATGGEVTPLATGTSGAASSVSSAYGTPVVTASGSAWQGTRVWQVPVAGAATIGSNLFAFGYFGVVPVVGTPYTVSYHIRSATGSRNPIVTPFVTWVDINGNTVSTATLAPITLTGLSSAPFTAVTQTSTVPAGAVAILFGIQLTNAPTLSWNMQADGIQLEQNSSASTFSIPGLNYGVFTGLFERYPQSWNFTGTYGYSKPVGVDSLAILSQTILPAAFIADVLALSPNFVYQLNDPAGATSCADSASKRSPAPVENSPYGPGSLVFGTSVSSATTAGGFVGAPGPVATFNNNPAAGGQHPQTFVSLHKTSAAPGPPSSGAWTRILAFKASVTPTAGNNYQLWNSWPPSYSSSLAQFQVAIASTTGFGTLTFADNSGINGLLWSGAVNLCDGNWHMMAMGVDPSSGSNPGWVDGVNVSTATGVGAATGWSTDTLGVLYQQGLSSYAGGYVGDMAFAIEIPALLTNTQMTNLYNSWRTAWSGDSSGARYSRILGWAGYTGSSAVDTGASTNLGPASDVVGSDALSALQAVVDTENGQHFVSKDGVITFQARTRRYGQTTPVYIFGDANPLGAEIPYEMVDYDYDPTHVSNYATVTQVSTNQSFIAQNLTSQGTFGVRNLSRNNQSALTTECQDAANYLVGRYKDAHLRVLKLRLHPSSNPTLLWPVCLSLELGMRVRVMRRPPAPAPTVQIDGFIEEIVHTADDKGEWFVDLQISSADLNKYWQLGALHTTLNLQAASGQNKATINALPDAAVNLLSQSLPSGYSLTFEPGTSRAETLALAAGGIPTTTLGYTSAQLTFATNFAFTHNAGTIVCEPLPTGVTDSTTWDSASVLGAAYARVVSGGAAGNTTITVGPMGDSATNGLGSNWNTNDVVWLSPGTPNFEVATIASVASSYPGYASVQLTLTANLAHSHVPGDFVCDPLPAGVTDPTTLAPTAKLAY